MKTEVRVAVVQFAPAWLDPVTNADRMASFAAREARRGADLVVFPELSNVGFVTPARPDGPLDGEMAFAEFAIRYRELAETIPGPTTDALASVAAKSGVHVVVGIAQKHPTVSGLLYNAAVLIGPDGIVGIHHKAHIPLNEKHFFAAGGDGAVWDTELGRIGMAICYDGIFPEFPRLLALRGAEIICNIWAISVGDPAALGGMGRLQYRAGAERLVHRAYTRAQENQVFYICCSRVGTQGSTGFLGHSVVAAPWGWPLARSNSRREEVIRATLPASELANARASISVYRDRRPDLYQTLSDPISDLSPNASTVR